MILLMEKNQGVTGLLFVNSKTFWTTTHFYENACAIVVFTVENDVKSISSFFSDIGEGNSDYLHDLKRNNFG